MGQQYIQELKRELSGRMLDIWRGHTDDGTPIDMDQATRQKYRDLWTRQAKTGGGQAGEPQVVFRKTGGPKPGGCGCGK